MLCMAAEPHSVAPASSSAGLITGASPVLRQEPHAYLIKRVKTSRPVLPSQSVAREDQDAGMAQLVALRAGEPVQRRLLGLGK